MTTFAEIAEYVSLCQPGENQRGLFTDATIKSAVPVAAGIYRLYAYDEKPLWVGQSHNLRERLLDWLDENHFVDAYSPWYFEYQLCQASLLDDVEQLQIRLLRPLLNVQRPLG